MTAVQERQRQAGREPEPGTAFPVIAAGETLGSVTDQISSLVLTRKTPLFWYLAFAVALVGTGFFVVSSTWLFYRGVGVFGINIPVAWGYAITNFVWWVGIGHAGTLISAILLLLNQGWRNSINRFAEAMTIFAVMCAGTVSRLPPWPPLVAVLAAAVPQHHAYSAAVPQPAGVGRVCRVHLRHRLCVVLVFRA